MDKDNMNKDNMNKDNMDGKDKGKDIDDKPQTFIDMKNHYEIEYLHFMINILEPFIEFKSGQSNDVTIIFKGKEASENKVINTKQFIHFIQITFPNFIKDEIINLKEQISIEHKGKDTFERFIKLGLDEFKEEYTKNNNNKEEEEDGIYNTIINMKDEEIEKRKKFYSDPNEYSKLDNIFNSKLTYLDRLLNFNKEKHSKVEGVLTFIKNIKYIL